MGIELATFQSWSRCFTRCTTEPQLEEMFGTSSVSKRSPNLVTFASRPAGGEKTRTRRRTSSVLVVNVFFVFLSLRGRTSMDDGTFRQGVDDLS